MTTKELLAHQVESNNGNCPICCAPVAQPYRATDTAGTVVTGCISAHHDGHVHDSWHMRPSAKTFRANQTANMKRLALGFHPIMPGKSQYIVT
jgi:hypothetical protein